MSVNTIHQIWMEGEEDLKQNEPHLYENVLKMRELHDDHHRLWTDCDIRRLIDTKYRALKAIYIDYPHEFMKVQLAKYIILCEEGGFYVDIDCKPKKCLYDLVHFQDRCRTNLPLVVKDIDEYQYKIKSTKKFIRNYFFYIPYPHHQFMRIILEQLPKCAKRHKLEPQLAWIRRSCGDLFFTKCVKQYKKMTSKELKKGKHKSMIHDLVTKHTEELTRSHSQSSLSRQSTWTSLPRSLSRSELKSEVHTQDIVNLQPADAIDYYLHHNGHKLYLNEKWIEQLNKYNKIKLRGAQAAVGIACVCCIVIAL